MEDNHYFGEDSEIANDATEKMITGLDQHGHLVASGRSMSWCKKSYSDSHLR